MVSSSAAAVLLHHLVLANYSDGDSAVCIHCVSIYGTYACHMTGLQVEYFSQTSY